MLEHSDEHGGKGRDLLAAFDMQREALPYLLRRAHARAEDLFTEIMCVDNLTPRQITALVASAQHPDATVSELADAVAVDLNTASSMIRRLIDRGLLSRQRSATDRRAWVIHLTREGEQTLAQVLPRNEVLLERIMEPLPPEYRPLFVKCLRLMLDIDD